MVSYLDTLEIAAFLGENPEFRPAPVADIASLYHLAWRWIRGGYIDDRHTFNLFSYGRGNYAYISLQREFQQIATSFAKIIVAHDSFMKTLDTEKITVIPPRPNLGPVARFEFFSTAKDRPEGVWLVRQGNLKFALPITVGTKPGMSDYLAAPFGLAGFANPVEEVYPSLVPFIELEDGKTYAASEGSSEIEPSADGQSLKVIWKKWGGIGSNRVKDRHWITSQVMAHSADKLVRNETLVANKDLKIKRWWVAVHHRRQIANFMPAIVGRFFTGTEGTLKVTASAIGIFRHRWKRQGTASGVKAYWAQSRSI